MSTPLNNSLLKGFAVLSLFSRDRPEIAAAGLMDELGMNAATAHRFLTTLEEAGAIVAVRRGTYRLSHRIAEMGRLAEETNPLVRQIQPVLDQLAADLGESVMACRLARRGPVCIATAIAPRPFAMDFRVGTVLNLLTSAQGRLFLAHMPPPEREKALREAGDDPAGLAGLAPELEAIRAAGLARNAGSAEPDVGALAVPVRSGGAPLLTLSVFGPLGRFSPGFRSAAAPRMLAAAAELERRLR